MTGLNLLTVLAQDVDGAGGAIGGIVACVFFLVIAVISIAFLIFWVLMLIDAIKRDFPGNEKIVWVLVIVLTGIIGAAIYFFVGRSRGTLTPKAPGA